MSTPGSHLMAEGQGSGSSQLQHKWILQDPVPGVGLSPSCVLQWASCCEHSPESVCSAARSWQL